MTMTTITIESPVETERGYEHQEILDWVNEQRVERGLEPLRRLRRGQRLIAANCPLARSLGDGALICQTHWRCNMMSPVKLDVPEHVRDFMTDFDRGGYSDLLRV
jgi:hypothetical protein